MKKAILLVLAIASGILAAQGAAQASKYSGEIKIKSIGSDNTQSTVNRFREFSTLPKDASLSLFKFGLPYLKKSSYLSFKGTDIGEDDVAANLSLIYKNYFTYEADYGKKPHLLDALNGYSTERVAESYKLRLFPLSAVSATAMLGVEDKTGRLSTSDYVGQKTKTNSFNMQGLVGTVTLAAGVSKEDFSENNVAHNSDGSMVSVNLKPNGNLWASLSQSKKNIDPSMSNAAAKIDIDTTETTATYALSDHMSIASIFSDRKRTNATAGAMSFEDKHFTTMLNLKSKHGKAGMAYTKTDRDFTGADINNRETHSINLKGSTRFSFIGLKAEYEHGYRDISGVNNASLINFNELSGEFSKRDITFTLLGFKKFNMSLFSKDKNQSFDVYNTYGTNSTASASNGLTANYTISANVNFTLSYFEMQNRMMGRQNYWTSAGGTGNRLIDTTIFSINDDTTYFQIGTIHQLKPSLCMYLDYSAASSDLTDPQRNNSIKDHTFSINLDKTLTSNYSVNFGYSRNVYSDYLDSSISPHSSIINFEIRKKF